MKVPAALAALVLLSSGETAWGESIKAGGAFAAMRALHVIGDAYGVRTPGSALAIVRGLGSRGGKAALLSGAVAVAVSADPLSDEDRRAGLVSVAWLKTPFVFAVSAAVPVSGIPSSLVPRIYAGLVTTWSDGSRLRLVLRPPLHSDNRYLRSISPAMAAAVDQALSRTGMAMATTDQDAAEAFETIPGAFGTSTLGLLLSEHRRGKVLALDGVMPSAATLADGSYPHAKTLYLLYRADGPPAVREFAAFATSGAAHGLLAPLGFSLIAPPAAR